jgi:AcrR family transcriptional regulator
MKQIPDTAAAIVSAARQLFALHGYDGTSVRAITSLAGANLGAITYHFGSKEALYGEVIASAMAPSRDRLAAAAEQSGAPLTRVEGVVRAFFDFLNENPDLPQLMLQQLSSSRPIPGVALRTMQGNIGILAGLISEGQADGSIRAGDPRLMALSIGAQPIWLTLARRALQEGVAIDQTDPETRAQLVESVVLFVRAGLAAIPERAE